MQDTEFENKKRELGITLNKSGKQYCPKCHNQRHDKSDKSLSVTYDDDNEMLLYQCHYAGCGFSGGIPYNSSKYKSKYVRPNTEDAKGKDDKKALYEYFEKRHISKETLDKYKVSIDKNGNILFPYYKDGNLVNIKTRHNYWDTDEAGNRVAKKKFYQTKDAEKTLYGMDFAKGQENLIIVEGEPDVLSFAEQGIVAVSVPQGGSEDKLECLANCSNEFIESFKNFIIAVDNDKTGEKLKNTLLTRFQPFKDKVKIVNWGQYKDANEALSSGEDLHKYIENAKYLQTDGIYQFDNSNTWDELYMELYGQDKTTVYETGWREFDKLVKIKTSYLMVVTGYPSRGKSYFVKNMLVNISRKYGTKHLIASFEDTKGSLYRALFEMYVKKTKYKIDYEYGNNAMEHVLTGEAYDFISEHFIGFENDRHWDIDSIIERTETEYIKHGIKTLVIDPYNRLKNDYKDREDKYIGEILSKLCMLAKKLDILIIFVAHPTKPVKGGENTPPTMYNVSGSGDWYNMADYGIVIHRNKTEEGLEDIVKINVEKVKNFSLGEPSGGSVSLNFNKVTRNIENF